MSQSSQQPLSTKLSAVDFFKSISSRFTIRQKIDFAVFKFDNNYFLNQEPAEIEDLPDEVVRPLRMITKDNLNIAVSRDQRAKSKKLSWAMKELENENFSSFKARLDPFTSVRAAEDAAAKLYSEHNREYSALQATIKSVDGESYVPKTKPVRHSQQQQTKLVTTRSCNSYLIVHQWPRLSKSSR